MDTEMKTRTSDQLVENPENKQLVKTSSTPGGIASVSFPFERPERDEILKAKTLAVLASDQEFPRWWGPARWSWTNVRRELGGRVKSEHFRRLVDELLAAGLVLEVYEAARGWGWREHRHLLVRTDRWDEVEWGQLVEVRGREEVVGRLGPEVEVSAAIRAGTSG